MLHGQVYMHHVSGLMVRLLYTCLLQLPRGRFRAAGCWCTAMGPWLRPLQRANTNTWKCCGLAGPSCCLTAFPNTP
jgi:hypothetical protein